MNRVYDGTKESSDAAWTKAKQLASDARAAVEKAISLLEQAQAVHDEEERRHDVPSPSQHTSVMWQGLTGVLENVACCLGADNPYKHVFWNGEDFEIDTTGRPSVTNVVQM